MVPTSLDEMLVFVPSFHTVLPHGGGPAYTPGGVERLAAPRMEGPTVLPREGGPAYPPDGADELSASLWLAQAVLPHAKEGQLTLLTEPNDNQTPGSKAFTVLPHVGGEDWANHKAVELLPRVACPSPPSLPSSRTPAEGRIPLLQRLWHPPVLTWRLVPLRGASQQTAGHQCPCPAAP